MTSAMSIVKTILPQFLSSKNVQCMPYKAWLINQSMFKNKFAIFMKLKKSLEITHYCKLKTYLHMKDRIAKNMSYHRCHLEIEHYPEQYDP